MSIGLTDELEVKTKKGKLAAAKQIFLNGDQENLQQIGDKTHQLENAVKDITATGGASTANAVSYNNETSGMSAITVQGAIDELATKNKSQDTTIAAKAEKSDVQSSVSELKAKNTSQDAEIAKKANSADVTYQIQTEQSRVNTELSKKFDKESILQESGEAEDKVMSQKAINTELGKKADKTAVEAETKRAQSAEQAIIYDVSALKKNYVFAGIATPATNPGTPNVPVFYIAEEGTYANFSGLSVGIGELAVLKWNGTWSKQTIKVSLPPNELNISNIYNAQGIGGTNKYTLDGAIAQVPIEYRVQGLKVSFINESGDTEVWEYTGGSWEVGSFSEVGLRKIVKLEEYLAKNTYASSIKGSLFVSDVKLDKSRLWFSDKYKITADGYITNIRFNQDSINSESKISLAIAREDSGSYKIKKIYEFEYSENISCLIPVKENDLIGFSDSSSSVISYSTSSEIDDSIYWVNSPFTIDKELTQEGHFKFSVEISVTDLTVKEELLKLEEITAEHTNLLRNMSLIENACSVEYELGQCLSTVNKLSKDRVWFSERYIVKEDGFLTKIKICNYTEPFVLSIGIARIIDGAYQVAQLIEIDVSEVDTIVSIEVKKGDMIGFSDNTSLNISYQGSQDIIDKIWYINKPFNQGKQLISENSRFTFDVIITSIYTNENLLADVDIIKDDINRTKDDINRTKDDVNRIKDDVRKTITFAEVDTVLTLGSSLTEGANVTNGLSWVERLNDIVDYNIINLAVSGYDIKRNAGILIKNKVDYYASNCSISELNPKYVLWNNSANGTPIGEELISQLKNCKSLTERYGANMLLGTEEDYATQGKEYENTYYAFSEQNNIPFIPITRLWRMLYPTNNPYPGFTFGASGWKGRNHSGWRAMAAYFKYFDLLSKISVNKSIKLYKVRPTYKNGNPAISDLNYDNNFERLIRFYAATSNSRALIDNTGKLDNGDNSEYNVDGYNNSIKLYYQSPYISLLQGGSVSFDKFALIEFIIPNIKSSESTIEFDTDLQPNSVYITSMDSESTDIDGIRSNFVQVEFDRNNETNIVRIKDAPNMFLFDKVRVLVVSDGTFNLSNVKIYDWNGIKKDHNALMCRERKFGEELNEDTSFNTPWNYEGDAAVKSFPEEIANYTSYNTQKKHLQLDSDLDSAYKNILTKGAAKIAVRVVAQNFYKIATNRFIGTEIADSEYINSVKSDEINYSYDYGIINVSIDDNQIQKSIVWQGWHELYFEFTISPRDTEIKLRISRSSLVDENYNNHQQPILIHDVSVQRID